MAKNVIAFMYDFDKTLSPKDMQEYGFIPSLGYDDVNEFWHEVELLTKANKMDQILSYMRQMLKVAKANGKELTRAWFHELGKSVTLFPGVLEWFDLVNEEGMKRGLVIEHYIVSSGLSEIIEGTAIAQHFKAIYACEYLYEDEVAVWPAQAVNYTTKTQYIFRINKGKLDVTDARGINEKIEDSKRKVPFSQMVYIGDGMTDVPSMSVVKEKGGHSIAIYNELSEKSLEDVRQLVADERVNYCASADYRKGMAMHQIACGILDQIKIENNLEHFKKR